MASRWDKIQQGKGADRRALTVFQAERVDVGVARADKLRDHFLVADGDVRHGRWKVELFEDSSDGEDDARDGRPVEIDLLYICASGGVHRFLVARPKCDGSARVDDLDQPVVADGESFQVRIFIRQV